MRTYEGMPSKNLWQVPVGEQQRRLLVLEEIHGIFTVKLHAF